MGAWVKQLAKQVAKYGADNASWHVIWDEPDKSRRGKSCGPGKKGLKLANELRDRVNAQLTLGTYDSGRQDRKTWKDFTDEYRDKILTGLESSSLRDAMVALNHFGRICKLDAKPMCIIDTEKIDDFRSKRRAENGKKPGSKVSPATLNSNLRHIKAALRVAFDWKYLDAVPKIKFEREPKKLPTYVTPEHFAAIYKACDVARFPEEMPAGTGAWWRALLVMAQMTGWRIGELLALEWSDVDLDAGRAITRHSDNKGKRDDIVILHAVVVEHLQGLKTFHANVFPWDYHRRTLDVEFARIQDAAGIKLDCSIQRKHECTDACHRYSFHDERRAFATMNAASMTREALQALMRHASPLTTAVYINIANQLNPAVASLHVPDVLKMETA